MADPSTATSRYPSVMDPEAEHVGRVYAQAFLAAAEGEGPVQDRLDELDSFLHDLVAADPDFDAFLRSAIVDRQQKAQVLRTVLEGRASPILVNFLLVLNEHFRLDQLRPILHQCHRLQDERHGRVHVSVRSAVPLAESVQEEIRSRLREALQAEPVLEPEVAPRLLGGVVLQIGDRIYDGSLSTRLERLREQIIERSFHEIQGRRDRLGNPEGD